MICDISVYNPRIFCAGIGVLCSLGTDGLGDTTKYQISRDLVVINILLSLVSDDGNNNRCHPKAHNEYTHILEIEKRCSVPPLSASYH